MTNRCPGVCLRHKNCREEYSDLQKCFFSCSATRKWQMTHTWPTSLTTLETTHIHWSFRAIFIRNSQENTLPSMRATCPLHLRNTRREPPRRAAMLLSSPRPQHWSLQVREAGMIDNGIHPIRDNRSEQRPIKFRGVAPHDLQWFTMIQLFIVICSYLQRVTVICSYLQWFRCYWVYKSGFKKTQMGNFMFFTLKKHCVCVSYVYFILSCFYTFLIGFI